MNYFSTRNTKLNLSFKKIFFKGLSEDGGLFLPNQIPRLSDKELKIFEKYNFQQMSFKIFKYFIGDTFNDNELKNIIDTAYSKFREPNIIDVKILDHISYVQLHHGPTLAFKDIAMQVLGGMYELLLKSENIKINLVTATSGDTGAAAIDAIKDKKNVNIFVLHPHNKISSVQRQLMTTCNAENVFNIAIKGSFDDCQKIVKDMFIDQDFANKINMSGVNSINWARIIAQIVYYFFIYYKFNNSKKPIVVSVPTGNFGDIYAGYVAKQMGLNIKELIVATNQNNILQRCIDTGEYKPLDVAESISPSMDIQVASNFERFLFDVLEHSSSDINKKMSEFKSNGKFQVGKDCLEICQRHFSSAKVNMSEVKKVIKDTFESDDYLVDPHTAIGIHALSIDQSSENSFVLGTAHPVKFLDTVEESILQKTNLLEGYESLFEASERFLSLDNDVEAIKFKIIENS